ncbi:MAG TPA: asparagine synthase-related protein [Methanomassiliicoccales archaeon]|nr:asparagine synthase-related protein [Methanomassiliicoccales archaeon]HQM66210.1 asparagine synthase-related protein [Methanomassiliicoccales archaeon]
MTGRTIMGLPALQDEIENGLQGALTATLRRELTGPTAVLFSGGLDSVLLVALARQCADMRLYTVGYPGSHDLKAGERAAGELGLPWKGIVLDDDALRAAVIFLRERLGLSDPVVISFELPLYIVCATVPEGVLLSGQGADELFGGYARYAHMTDGERVRSMKEDLRALLAEGLPREERLATLFGKRLVCPYLSPETIKAAEAVPPTALRGELGNKGPLRDLALGLGLSVARAPKKAAQYGSGTMRAMKRMASAAGMPLGRWTREVNE